VIPNPREWEWEHIGDALVPITKEDLPASEVLLETIFCRCTKDCIIGKCGYRKAIMTCSVACLRCQGKCLNSVPVAIEDDKDDIVPVQQRPSTRADEDAIDEKPGPSSSKRMKT